jgi:hypothetical protein
MEKVMAEGSKAREISLGEGFGEVALKVNGATVEVHADGSVAAHTAGDVDAWTNASVRVHAAANDTGAKATLEIGAVALAGDHKGEIYGGILPSDNKPIWFLAAPKPMDHFNAASWATEQGGALPTRKQGDYLTILIDKGGAFTEIFNRGGSFPAGYVWLAEPTTTDRSRAWCQRLREGYQYFYDPYDRRTNELPVLCVRR